MTPPWRRRQTDTPRDQVLERIAEIVRQRTRSELAFERDAHHPEVARPTGDDQDRRDDEDDSYDLPDVPPGWGRR